MIVNVTGVLNTGILPTDGSEPLEPFSQPIVWPRGEEGAIKILVVDQLGAPVDLTAGGAALSMSVRHAATDSAPQLHVAGASLAADGTASFPLVAGDTLTQVIDIYRADFWLTKSGTRSQIIPGSNFTIGESVGP